MSSFSDLLQKCDIQKDLCRPGLICKRDCVKKQADASGELQPGTSYTDTCEKDKDGNIVYSKDNVCLPRSSTEMMQRGGSCKGSEDCGPGLTCGTGFNANRCVPIRRVASSFWQASTGGVIKACVADTNCPEGQYCKATGLTRQVGAQTLQLGICGVATSEERAVKYGRCIIGETGRKQRFGAYEGQPLLKISAGLSSCRPGYNMYVPSSQNYCACCSSSDKFGNRKCGPETGVKSKQEMDVLEKEILERDVETKISAAIENTEDF